jgi:hypothetical protein
MRGFVLREAYAAIERENKNRKRAPPRDGCPPLGKVTASFPFDPSPFPVGFLVRMSKSAGTGEMIVDFGEAN